MRSVPVNRASARWPFWLLVIAWFCANSPQAATYEVVVWLKGMGRFSHQARLTAEICAAVSGQELPQRYVAARSAAERPEMPAVPAEATLKKIVLVAGGEERAVGSGVGVGGDDFGRENWSLPDEPRLDAVHPPPRVRVGQANLATGSFMIWG